MSKMRLPAIFGNIWSKWKKNCTLLIKSLILREKYCCSMNSSCSEVLKTVPDVIFIMSGAHLIWIFVICFLVKACILKYSWFWHLTFRWLFGHYIDFWSKFLLGTKIAHVWEENESLVISIWEDSDAKTVCCKITHSMENAVA